MNRENLKAVSDALHNGAESGEVWGKMCPKLQTDGCRIFYQLNPGGLKIWLAEMLDCDGTSRAKKETAQLFCRAVNAHNELLAALTNALERLEASQPPDGGATFAVVVQCRLALLNAKPNAEKSL